MSTEQRRNILEKTSLDDLLCIAQKFGIINLWQSPEDKTFSFSIDFTTHNDINLKAHSGYNHVDMRTAVIEAIIKAYDIIDLMKKLPDVDLEERT